MAARPKSLSPPFAGSAQLVQHTLEFLDPLRLPGDLSAQPGILLEKLVVSTHEQRDSSTSWRSMQPLAGSDQSLAAPRRTPMAGSRALQTPKLQIQSTVGLTCGPVNRYDNPFHSRPELRAGAQTYLLLQPRAQG